MDRVLGIDIGGTSIRSGLFTPEGELLEERKIPTPALTTDDAYAVVTSGIARILAAHDSAPADVIACGLDIPGPVAEDGTVGFLPNIELDPEGLVGAITAAFPRADRGLRQRRQRRRARRDVGGLGARRPELRPYRPGYGRGRRCGRGRPPHRGRPLARAARSATSPSSATSRSPAAAAATAASSSTPPQRAWCASTSRSASAAA